MFPTVRAGVYVAFAISAIFGVLAVTSRGAETIKPHALIFIIAAIIGASFGAYINGGIDGYIAPLLIIAPIAAGYFVGLRATIVCGLVSILLAVGLILLDLNGLVVESPYNDRMLTIASGIIVISTIILGMACIVSFAVHVREDAAALREGSAKLTAFARSAPIAIAMFDRDLRYLEVSERWLSEYGLQREKIIGRGHYEIFPEIPQSWKDVHARCLAGATERSDADRFERADGTIHWMMWEVKPWHDLDGNVAGLVMITRDISARMEEQAELEAARESASRVSAMKSAFLANLSHEIRTPLNGMMGLAQSMMDDDLTDEQKQKASTIHDTGSMMLTLLNDVLDMSKLEAEKMELNPTSNDLKSVIGKTLDLFRPSASEKGLALKAFYDEGLPAALLFDSTRVGQCLNNLLSNAVKFTEAGSIEIKAGYEQNEDGSGGMIVIDVSDTGIGVDPQNRNSLFTDYTQADSSIAATYGGTGLGLSLSRRLARLMDGDLSLLKTTREGSTFRLTFIAHIGDSPAASSEVAIDTASLSCLKGSRVLIADDVQTNRMVAGLFLEPHGATILHAANGQEVLDILETEEVDLVLLDLQMPVLDGTETINRIRANTRRWASLPVIALTGEADVQDRPTYLRMGLTDVIVKPIEKNRFLMTVSEHLQQVNRIRNLPRLGSR
ncbi:response regulator [Parvularcula flava]|nr:PAS domain-containing sensor histidine kinase [Aquisalinus luteolus]NHK26864.1 response regulator [Aquisalinus luteolus]